jgi:hypothetical protein
VKAARCKDCGSTDLWGNHFDADGLADPAGTWGYLCENCGTVNSQADIEKRKSR